MADFISIKVDGLEDIQALFKAATRKGRSSAKRKALTAATAAAADALRGELRTTSSFRARTGRLRRRTAVARRTKKDAGHVGFSKAAYYGRFIDQGTKYIEARGFSDRVVEQKQAEIVAAYSAAYAAALKKHARGLGLRQ